MHILNIKLLISFIYKNYTIYGMLFRFKIFHQFYSYIVIIMVLLAAIKKDDKFLIAINGNKLTPALIGI